jgi:hypothetical protein
MTTRPTRRAGWMGFTLWAVVGVLMSLSLAGAASIGLFVAPFAVLAAVLVARRNDAWPAQVGLAAGLAVLLLWIASVNLDYTPCTGEPLVVYPGEPAASCGGWNPLPFAVAGGLVLVGAVAAFAGLRTRR